MDIEAKEEIIKLIREEVKSSLTITVEEDMPDYYSKRVDHTISLWMGDDLVDKIVIYG